jgi:putative ABC transport system substrate-binding protein
MNKIFLLLACLALFALWFFYPQSTQEENIKIGIVVPMQHVALEDITSGFKKEIANIMGEQKINIQVQNALGDINLQKSAINKFLNDKVNLLVTLGTGTTQMAINLASQEQPLLFLAANMPPGSPAEKARPGLMGVVDEVAPLKQLKFIRAALPNLRRLTLIFSSNDKMPDDAAAFSEACMHEGMRVQQLMIQNLAELYTVASRIEPDSQAIIILKDNMVVSGIEALIQQAEKLKIPLITSDEGSNSKGGAFALGVIEADIGRQGAQIAAQHFAGKNIAKPIEFLDKISVFINKKACEKQGVNILDLIKAAELQKYEVIQR